MQTEVSRAGFAQPVDRLQDSGDRQVGTFRTLDTHQLDQFTDRLERRPAGHYIVAEVGEAAGAQALVQYVEHVPAIVFRDPVQHAVRDDVLEFREVGRWVFGEVRERGFDKRDVAQPGPLRQT